MLIVSTSNGVRIDAGEIGVQQVNLLGIKPLSRGMRPSC
jgi:hypothetical protein